MADADAAGATAGAADERRGLAAGEASIDPFAVWLTFAKSVRAGKVRTAFVSFLERWKEPIDVKVDKRIDLAKLGKGPELFLKTPRTKRPDELNSDISDRMKHDCERQFNLRNLSRYVKTVNRGDPLEYKRKAVEIGKLDVDARAHMKDVYKKIEGIELVLGAAQVRAERAWRYRMLEVMQWERYFSKEIREEFSGPLWKHDPDTNPVGAQGRQTADKDPVALPGPTPAPAAMPAAATAEAPAGDEATMDEAAAVAAPDERADDE